MITSKNCKEFAVGTKHRLQTCSFGIKKNNNVDPTSYSFLHFMIFLMLFFKRKKNKNKRKGRGEGFARQVDVMNLDFRKA